MKITFLKFINYTKIDITTWKILDIYSALLIFQPHIDVFLIWLLGGKDGTGKKNTILSNKFLHVDQVKHALNILVFKARVEKKNILR